MVGLSTTINNSALPLALDTRCGLELQPTYGHLVVPGMEELQIASDIQRCSFEDQPVRVLNGLRLLGRALRSFSNMGYRCTQFAVSNRLSLHARRLLDFEQLNASSVRPDENGVWEVHVEDADVGGPLRRASAAWRNERYKQAGLSLALALVYAAGGDNFGGDEPLGHRDVWGGFARIDPRGTIPTVAALEAHFVQLRHRRIDMLFMEERRLAALPRPPLLGTNPSTGARVPIEEGDMCCCCWALPTDAQERATHSEHVW